MRRVAELGSLGALSANDCRHPQHMFSQELTEPELQTLRGLDGEFRRGRFEETSLWLVGAIACATGAYLAGTSRASVDMLGPPALRLLIGVILVGLGLGIVLVRSGIYYRINVGEFRAYRGKRQLWTESLGTIEGASVVTSKGLQTLRLSFPDHTRSMELFESLGARLRDGRASNNSLHRTRAR